MVISEASLVYFLDGKMYINLTNKCTNDCLFCIRAIKDDVKGASMWLEQENASAQCVIDEIIKVQNQIGTEVTFCGYGEPLARLDALLEVARFIKSNYPNVKIRINTNGHGNLIYARNIVNDLVGLVDSVSVSLNAQNEALYNELAQPKIDGAYQGVKDFIQKCVEAGIDTVATVVSDYEKFDVDEVLCEKISRDLGANFKARPWLRAGY